MSHLQTNLNLKMIFKNINKSGSGQLSVHELQRALSNGTPTPFNIKTVKLIIKMFDKKRKKTINFQEFPALSKYVNEWINCFHKFDKDKSGYIDKEELTNALISLGNS